MKKFKEPAKIFRVITEESPTMIFINRRGRIDYVNKKCVEIMGYSKEEFYSPDFDFMTLIAPESRDLVKHNLNKHIKGVAVPPYEYKLLTKGGREIIGLHTTKLIEVEGEKAILGIIIDISKRKETEEKLRKKIEELENWQRLTTGREIKMVELKKEINKLKERFGE